MPSIGTFRAQPVTRTFIVTQDQDNDEYGAKYFTQANIDSWYEDNTDNITKVSEGMYIVTGTFRTTIRDLNNSGSFDIRRSLIDLGKEIVIGSEEESRLIVLRKVRSAGPPAKGGDGGIAAYIIVESNYRSSGGDPPSDSQFNVNVARA
jgi:hypothetical protein